jgi:hypothetical protein
MLHKKTAVDPIVEALLAKQPSKSAIAPKAETGESAIVSGTQDVMASGTLERNASILQTLGIWVFENKQFLRNSK